MNKSVIYIMLVLACILTGCRSSTPQGTYVNGDDKFTFTKDSLIIDNANEGFFYTYAIKGNRLITVEEAFKDTETYQIEILDKKAIKINGLTFFKTKNLTN